MKRAQFEIMGLAIVIVLVILGFLLYLFLNARTPQEDVATTYENEQLAQTIVDAMLRAQVGPPCADSVDATLYDLVRDVTIVQMGICDSASTGPGGPVGASLALLGNASEAIIQNSTNSKYIFTVTLESDPTKPVIDVPSASTKLRCPTNARVQFERTGEQRIRLLPTTDTALIELKLCPGV